MKSQTAARASIGGARLQQGPPAHIIGWRILQQQHMAVLLFLLLAMQLKGVRTTLSEVTGEQKTTVRGIFAVPPPTR